MTNKRLALTQDEGYDVYCTASEENIGKGRCNHVLHGEPNDPKGFEKLVEEYKNSSTSYLNESREPGDTEPVDTKYPFNSESLDKFADSIYEYYNEEDREKYYAEDLKLALNENDIRHYTNEGWYSEEYNPNTARKLYQDSMYSYKDYLRDTVRLFLAKKYQENGINSKILVPDEDCDEESDEYYSRDYYIDYADQKQFEDSLNNYNTKYLTDSTRLHIQWMNRNCDRLGLPPVMKFPDGVSPLDCDHRDISKSLLEFSLDRSLYKDKSESYGESKASDEKVNKVYNIIKDNILHESIRQNLCVLPGVKFSRLSNNSIHAIKFHSTKINRCPSVHDITKESMSRGYWNIINSILGDLYDEDQIDKIRIDDFSENQTLDLGERLSRYVTGFGED